MSENSQHYAAKTSLPFVIFQVSLMVPNYPFSTSKTSSSADPNSTDPMSTTTTEVKVIRSISDVVKNKSQQQQQHEADLHQQSKSKDQQQVKQLSGRKTKEERRISNRQKLLSLKRHSGFLKRPEILEPVYSVEEDGEGAAQAQQHLLSKYDFKDRGNRSFNNVT